MTIIVFIVFLESPAGKPGTINFLFFCLILQPISHGGVLLEAPRPGVCRVALILWFTTMGENRNNK